MRSTRSSGTWFTLGSRRESRMHPFSYLISLLETVVVPQPLLTSRLFHPFYIKNSFCFAFLNLF